MHGYQDVIEDVNCRILFGIANIMPTELIHWTCPGCRLSVRVPTESRPIRCTCGFVQYQNPPGLGDWVAICLARVGITSRRYKRIKRAVGLKADCKCPERQKWLNEVGRSSLI